MSANMVRGSTHIRFVVCVLAVAIGPAVVWWRTVRPIAALAALVDGDLSAIPSMALPATLVGLMALGALALAVIVTLWRARPQREPDGRLAKQALPRRASGTSI